ncbi:MAG: NAD(P)-dependent oxidoreductase, partial [Caulobacteraceae bacterium]
ALEILVTAETARSRLDGAGAERLRAGSWRVIVVGAGGWLGLATLELLHGLFGQDFHRHVACFGSNSRTLSLRGGLEVEQQALQALGELTPAPSLVLHLAFLTQEKAKAMSEDAYVEANRAISRRVLEALDPLGAEGLFLPSSGAVYSIDHSGPERSKQLYGSLKREDEDRFAAWAEERGAKVVIARVFNLSGPYINKRSSYALACFIADALAGRPIRIAASRPVYRSYVAISELMSVVLGALTDAPAPPLAFDTAGDDVYEMARIAEMVGNALGHPLGHERPALRVGDIDRYVGDGSTYGRLRRLYGVTPVGFIDQVRETARYMAECKDDR